MLFDKWLWYSRLKRLTKSFSSFVNMLTFFSISIPSFIDVCSCTTFLHISTKDNTCKHTYSICKLISFNIIKSKKLTLSRFPSLLLFVCHVVFSRFMPSKRFRGISRNTHFWTVIQFQLPTAVFCYELETCFSAAILPSVDRSGWSLAEFCHCAEYTCIILLSPDGNGGARVCWPEGCGVAVCKALGIYDSVI